MENLHTSSTEVGDIFALFGEKYKQEHKLPLQHRSVMFAIEHCRTSVLGGHVDECDHCGHKQISYNSCRNRHCPKCQGLNRIKWIDKLSSNLLPVRYFHIVFTIPCELNRLTLVNQKCLYDILFKAASESLLMLAKDKKYLNADTGLVAVLHTWGQNLMEHPHLHTLVPAGGWNENTQYWKSSRKNFFIPVKVISAVFRGKFLSMLKQNYLDNKLKFEGEIKTLDQKIKFKQLLDILYSKPWVVYAEKPFMNASHIIAYLGRYTHRVAISNKRIISIDGNHIIFKWKDYNDHGKQKIMRLDATEFIRRFLLHILPKGFCKIRYFGIFASRNRKTVLTKCKNVLRYKFQKPQFVALSWQQTLMLVSGIDVSICPMCKKGNMIRIVDFKSQRDPPNLIKNV
jgi:hypothetical protein